MGASLNRVTLIGHLGKDPETRHLPNGDVVCNITVATSESWKDKVTGEKKEITEWHKIVFFRQLAEIAGKYLQKGAQVYIDGALKTRKWQDKYGSDRYTTEIVGGEMKMLGGGGRREDSAQQRSSEQAPAAAARMTAQESKGRQSFDDSDDIPF